MLRKAYSLRESRLLAKLNGEEDDELDEEDYSYINSNGEDFDYYSSSGNENEYYDNDDLSLGDNTIETTSDSSIETTSKDYHRHSIFMIPFINFVQLFR